LVKASIKLAQYLEDSTIIISKSTDEGGPGIGSPRNPRGLETKINTCER